MSLTKRMLTSAGLGLALCFSWSEATAQPATCAAVLAAPFDSLSKADRSLLFGPSCRTARERAVLGQLGEPIPVTDNQLMHVQRLADQLDSDALFAAGVSGFKTSSLDDETRLFHLWVAAKQARLPYARGAVLRRRTFGPKSTERLFCNGDFQAPLPDPIDAARAEHLGRVISEVGASQELSAGLLGGLDCFVLALPAPPPVLPQNVTATYDCNNRFWIARSRGLGNRVPPAVLRRAGHRDTTIVLPPGGAFPYEMPTADAIEIWHNGALLKRVEHGHESCNAKAMRGRGRPLSPQTDTLARWEWRTAAQIAEDGRSAQRIRR